MHTASHPLSGYVNRPRAEVPRFVCKHARTSHLPISAEVAAGVCGNGSAVRRAFPLPPNPGRLHASCDPTAADDAPMPRHAARRRTNTRNWLKWDVKFKLGLLAYNSVARCYGRGDRRRWSANSARTMTESFVCAVKKVGPNSPVGWNMR